MLTKTHYMLHAADPNAHTFAITCILENPNPKGQSFYLPAWIPGSYKIRDFAKQVSQMQATAGGKPLACHKIDKSTWQCAPTEHSITLTYHVYAWDLSVRGAHFDQTHAFINGSSVFVCPTGAEENPCTVEINKPSEWKMAVALPQDKNSYHAKNYAELIDSPIEMGTFHVEHFVEQGIPHELVFTGLAPNTDTQRIAADVQKICNYYLNFFPKPYPMQRYVFLIQLLDHGFGGLEHHASCSLHFSKNHLPTVKETQVSENYMGFLSLCSHEYLHTWLVKGMKPAAFSPYHLQHENYTAQLWIFEGFTFYYENLALVRAGLISPQQYYTVLQEKITRLWRTPGRLVQSVTESSFDAWIKLYQPDEHTPNITISYYLKGAFIALILDLQLRAFTKSTLDTLLLTLWKEYGHAPHGVPEHAVEEWILAEGNAALNLLFNKMLYTTEELPLADAFPLVGLTLSEKIAPTPDLGIAFDANHPVLTLQTCFTGGAAQRAGLSAGDVIIALNGSRIESQTLAPLLARYNVGDHVTLHAFRRDQLLSFSVTLQSAFPTAHLLAEEDAVEEVKLRRDNWLQM